MYSSLQPRWQLSLREHTGSIAVATALQPHQESPHPPGSSPEDAPCPCPVRAGPVGTESHQRCILLGILGGREGGREGRG